MQPTLSPSLCLNLLFEFKQKQPLPSLHSSSVSHLLPTWQTENIPLAVCVYRAEVPGAIAVCDTYFKLHHVHQPSATASKQLSSLPHVSSPLVTMFLILRPGTDPR